MLVYRISKREYIDDLSGTGAGLFGARWNPKGISMLYTSGSISLASLEYLVHNYHLLSRDDTVLAEIEIHSGSIKTLKEKDLPQDWNEHSYTPLSTQQIGLQFLTDCKYYILKIPSAIGPLEFNYFINPQHEAHQKTRIKNIIDPFEMDDRLFLRK